MYNSAVNMNTVQGQVPNFTGERASQLSYKFNLKAGTMKFLLNACIDTLPSKANLMRWKKSPSDLCKLCKGRQTSNHVLNICKVGLNTGRFKWRHDNILSYLVSLIETEKFEVYSDLPGHQAAGGGTVPPEVAVTTLVPDIVVINKLTKDIEIWELTVPMEENIEKKNSDKMKYGHFPTDFTPLKCHLLATKVLFLTETTII